MSKWHHHASALVYLVVDTELTIWCIDTETWRVCTYVYVRVWILWHYYWLRSYILGYRRWRYTLLLATANQAGLKLSNHLYSLLCRLVVKFGCWEEKGLSPHPPQTKDSFVLSVKCVHTPLSRRSWAADTVAALVMVQLDVDESHVLCSAPPLEVARLKFQHLGSEAQRLLESSC